MYIYFWLQNVHSDVMKIHNMPIWKGYLTSPTPPLTPAPRALSLTHMRWPGVQLCGLLKDCLHYLWLLLLVFASPTNGPTDPRPLPLMENEAKTFAELLTKWNRIVCFAKVWRKQKKNQKNDNGI